MAFSVSPSVIVREVDASQAVPAVATPPAAMVGVFKWGPVNEPILISSENDLVNRFGKPDDTNYETFFTAADYLSYSNALYVVRAEDGAETAKSTVLDITTDANGAILQDDSFYGAFQAKYPGVLGSSIEVAWSTSEGFENEIFEVGSIPSVKVSDANTSQILNFNSNTVSFEASNTDIVDSGDLGVGDIVVIGNDSIGYQELQVSAFTSTPVNVQATPGDANTAYVAYYSYQMNFTRAFTLAAQDLNDISITKKWNQHAYFSKAPDANTSIHVAVIDKTGDISGAPNTILEKFDNLSITPGATLPQGTTNYYQTVIENFSKWVSIANTTVIESAVLGSSGISSQYEEMEIANSSVQTETSVTLANLGFAFDTLKNGNEIDISFILQGKGDDAGTRANYIISNLVETRKDCVAFISPSKEAVVDEAKINTKMKNVIAYRNKIQNSSYAFMDSGYKYRYDKYNDVYRWTPLNGDMAGLSARVEPWESPAGYRKGVIKNVVKLAFNPNKAQRDQLYSADINPVMSQVGQGIVLFGDKTMLGLTSAFDRINVRRLFISIQKSIATAAESFLFEFNDEFTQTQFRNIVDPFLRDIQGRRGIIDYRVVSDSSVNTPEIIDQNKFRANIFIKPARSINVIELTFVATRTGVEFDEIVGQIT